MSGRRQQDRPALRVRMLSLGRFFGVPVYFAPSWLVIAALLTATYGPVVERSVPDISSSSAYLLAFAYSVLFALCVLAHELGHTAVSLRLGHPVKRVIIFLLGGVSEIEREPDRPRAEFLIAAAGPLVSAVLAGLFALAAHHLGANTMLGVLTQLLFWGNAIVVVFNLLPGLPLDGGRLLRALVWTTSRSRLTGTKAGAWAGRVLAFAVLVLAAIGNAGGAGVVSALVGTILAGYLWFGASQSLKHATLLDRLPQLNLEALLRPGLLVQPDLSVDAALRRMWQGSARGLVLVDAADRPAAIVDEARVTTVPMEQRPWVPLSALARPLEDGLILRRGLDGEALLAAVRRTPASEYLVVDDDGAPAGILATTDLAAALRA
jgi:Zn-dependent protease/CBS domain-containing protein